MRRLQYTCLSFLLISAASCSPKTAVTSEPAPGFLLTNYQTFSFYQTDASGNGLGAGYAPQVAMLQKELAQQLKSRGLQLSRHNPDLLVNIGVVVNEKTQTRETNFRNDAPLYIGQRRYSWESKEVPVGHYKTGTVSVDLVDRARNGLVWQGTATGVLPNKQAKLQQRVAEGVQKLVSRIP